MDGRRRGPSRSPARRGRRPATEGRRLPRPRTSRAVVVLLSALLALLVPGWAGATGDGDAAAGTTLVSGVEGSKAALVRIEVSATAEIAHLDHSTGEVHVIRGRYTLPIRSGTGVLASSDGVILTGGRTLTVTEDEVVVHAANRLFQEQMGAQLVGNDGDPSRRAQAVDPQVNQHLQNCYEHHEHCLLFFVPNYQVLLYTQEQAGTPADLVREPSGPADVGLLRISAGGATPTAELAPADQEVPAEALLAGFTAPPATDVPVTEMVVSVDPATGALSSEADLAGALGAGAAGGPVLDPGSGEVVGLSTVVDDDPVLIPVRAVHDALSTAGVQPAGSEFDAVFRRGLDHMASGHSGGPAASAFEESLTYFDSALAAQHLQRAQEAGDGGDDAAAAPGEDGDGLLGGVGAWLLVVLVALVLLGLAALFLRRRAGRRPQRAGPPAAATTAAARPAPAHAPAAAPSGAAPGTAASGPPPESRGQPSGEGTRLRDTPALLKDPARPGRQAQAFCTDCGAPLRDGARYCGSCGAPVE